MSTRHARNPYVGITYIPDNPRMETPPAFFLQRLHDYDGDLVILPSRYKPFAYVIARRRYYSAGLTDKALESTITQPDTLMCLHYGLVPVCLMYKHGPTWNPDTVLQSLMARDLWAHGGADKVCDMLEQQEEDEKAKQRAATREDLWHRSGDAWRSYQARTGQRVGYTSSQEARTAGRRISNSPSSSSTATGHTDWSRRD